MLKQLDCLIEFVLCQLVNACLKQQVRIVRRKLQALFIRRRRLGSAPALLQQHSLQLDGWHEIRILFEQTADKIHCPLPVAALSETKRPVQFPHLRRLGWAARALRMHGDSSSNKESGHQQQYGNKRHCLPLVQLLLISP